jgi:hypothetical protein
MATALAPASGATLAPILRLDPFKLLRQMRADKLAMLARYAQLGPVSRIQSKAYVLHLLTSPEAVVAAAMVSTFDYFDLSTTSLRRPCPSPPPGTALSSERLRISTRW